MAACPNYTISSHAHYLFISISIAPPYSSAAHFAAKPALPPQTTPGLKMLAFQEMSCSRHRRPPAKCPIPAIAASQMPHLPLSKIRCYFLMHVFDMRFMMMIVAS
jgi:hypothetical protein